MCKKINRTRSRRQTHKHTNTQTDKHTNRQTHKHTNRQTHKQTNRQTHKHTNTHKQANTQARDECFQNTKIMVNKMEDNIKVTQWSTCKEFSEDKRPPTPTALQDKDEFLPRWQDSRAPRDAPSHGTNKDTNLCN